MAEMTTRAGRTILFDDEDHDLVGRWRWGTRKDGAVLYAVRTQYLSGGAKHRKQRILYMHRVIMGFPAGEVDHLNGNGLDNRRANLRVVSQMENQRNRSGPQSNSKSGIRGVFWIPRRGKWHAQIGYLGRPINLGTFNNVEDAKEARRLGELKYWSEQDRVRANNA